MRHPRQYIYLKAASPLPQAGDEAKVAAQLAQIGQACLENGNAVTLVMHGSRTGGVSQGLLLTNPDAARILIEALPDCSLRLIPAPLPEAVRRALSAAQQGSSQAFENMPSITSTQGYVRDLNGPTVGGTRRHDDRIGLLPLDNVDPGNLAPQMIVPPGFLEVFRKPHIIPIGQAVLFHSASQWMGVVSALRQHSGVFLLLAEGVRVSEGHRKYARQALEALTDTPQDGQRSDLFEHICAGKEVVRLLPVIYCPGGAKLIEPGLFSDLGGSFLEPAPGRFPKLLAKLDSESRSLLSALPCLYTMQEAALLLRLAYSTEAVAGLEQNAVSAFGRPQVVEDAASVFIGTQIRDGIGHSEPFCCFFAHCVVVARPGMGKSNLLQYLIEQFLLHPRVRVLALDYIKGEHAAYIRSRGGRVFDLTSPLLNLLIPGENEYIDQCIRRVAEVWVCIRASNQVGLNGCEDLLRDGYRTRYTAATNKIMSPENFLKLKGSDLLEIPGAIPTLEQIVDSGKKYVAEKLQKRNANRDRDRVSFFEDMLNSVNDTRIRFLFTGDNSAVGLLFDENAAVDFDLLGDDDLKRAFIRGILSKQREHRIAQKRAGMYPRHFTLLDEAHNVLPAGAQNRGNVEMIDGAQQLAEQMANNLFELRGYGESFILASQSPSELSQTVLRTAGVLICMGIQEGTDRRRLRDAMGLTDSQTAALSGLDKGEAIISIQGRSPYQTKIPLMPMFQNRNN